MQEATREVEALSRLVGGHFHREPLPGRIYGLAVWSSRPLPPTHALPLPISTMPGRLPRRLAQLVRIGDIAFANVHLSHGQLLNRRQLTCITRSLHGPAAIIGDCNAVGPIMLRGFRDVGPRKPTHRNVLPFRLDRCLVRGVVCSESRVLARGPSDHCPIVLELSLAAVQPVTRPDVSAAQRFATSDVDGIAAATGTAAI